MDTINYYTELIRPDWAPPAWIFGPVWTLLYAIIIITFGYVIYKYLKKEVKFMTVLPFILNLVFNLSFTYFQFGLKNNILASIDILLILGTLLWFIFAIDKKYKWVAIANIPYLAWVSYATILQLTITYMNL